MAEGRKLSLFLVDPDFDVAYPQVFGQAKGVAFVVFRSPASPHADHDDLLHVGCKNSAEPVRVGSFF